MNKDETTEHSLRCVEDVEIDFNELKENDFTSSQKHCLKAIRLCSALIDYFVLILSVLLLVLSAYAMWDSHKVYQAASAEEFVQYKPVSGDDNSYQKLREINHDIIGWIEVYGTHIDYPVLQTDNNDKYLDETVNGEYSTAGSIFLDCRNSKDFSDFNSIIYGHHMSEGKMFGDLDKFAEKDFFETHKYGKLQLNDKRELGIEFMALVKTHGSDSKIFGMGIHSANEKKALVEHVYQNALQSREIAVEENDRLVFLDTCNFTFTNGRFILVGKLTAKASENSFAETEETKSFSHLIKKVQKIPLLFWLLLLLILLIILIFIIELIVEKHRRKKQIENNLENTLGEKE